MEKYIIIVAGGKGNRLGSEIPKQFLPIHGKPILMHTIEKFYLYDKNINIIVILPESHLEYWKLLCNEYSFEIKHKTVIGGEERFFSVKNALECVPSNVLVGIHDAVRPFVSLSVIEKAFSLAQEKQAIAPAIKPTESIRSTDESDKSTPLNREHIFLVQTPQCFHSNIIKNAYSSTYSPKFTDDLTVVENTSEVPIYLFEGNKENIKITTPFDLNIAEILFNIEHNI